MCSKNSKYSHLIIIFQKDLIVTLDFPTQPAMLVNTLVYHQNRPYC